MTSLSPLAGTLSTIRSIPAARPVAAATTPVVAATKREEPGAASTGSLIRTAGEQLDQFDRVMEKLRTSMATGAVTYGGASATGRTGQIVDRLA